MERIRNTLGWEWGASRRVALAQNTTASHIITLITLMRTTLRAIDRLDARTHTYKHTNMKNHALTQDTTHRRINCAHTHASKA